MKKNLKNLLVLMALTLLMAVFWIIGLVAGNAIFPSSLMDGSAETGGNGELMLVLICMLNSFALLYFISNTRIIRWRLVGTTFLIAFGIQFFMSQIETFWFNDSLKMPVNLIWAVVTGGAIMYVLFSIVATLLTGNFKLSTTNNLVIGKTEYGSLLKTSTLLAVIIWPLVYFMAGYLIAWQFSEVRNYYSGSTEMASFYSIMKENVISGLYFFQILRGALWVLIALLVLSSTNGSWIRKGIILGLLLSLLGSSQLLLPNPIMPEMVRIPHLIETSASSFLWGIILAWSLTKYYSTRETVAIL